MCFSAGNPNHKSCLLPLDRVSFWPRKMWKKCGKRAQNCRKKRSSWPPGPLEWENQKKKRKTKNMLMLVVRPRVNGVKDLKLNSALLSNLRACQLQIQNCFYILKVFSKNRPDQCLAAKKIRERSLSSTEEGRCLRRETELSPSSSGPESMVDRPPECCPRKRRRWGP